MRPEGEPIHQSDEVTPLQLIEAGGRTALVCVTDQALSERIAQAVRKLNYHVVVAQDPSSILSRMEFDQYQLIVLDGRFGGKDSADNPMLLHLQRLPMPLRRKSFLCLLSQEAPTLDHMAAFLIGANVMLNLQDVEKLPVILERLVKDHETLYAVFVDELTERGASAV